MSRSAATSGSSSPALISSEISAGAKRPRRLDDALDDLDRLEGLRAEIESPGVELVRKQDLVDDATEALRLVGDQRDEAIATAFVEGEIVAQKRLRRPVDGGERRAKLVGRRGDEIGLELLELMHLRQVAKRVDGPPVEVHARDRDPALASIRLERDHDLGMAGIG